MVLTQNAPTTIIWSIWQLQPQTGSYRSWRERAAAGEIEKGALYDRVCPVAPARWCLLSPFVAQESGANSRGSPLRMFQYPTLFVYSQTLRVVIIFVMFALGRYCSRPSHDTCSLSCILRFACAVRIRLHACACACARVWVRVSTFPFHFSFASFR